MLSVSRVRKGKAQAIYLHKTSDVFFRLIPDIEDIITIIEQEYSELSKAYQEKKYIVLIQALKINLKQKKQNQLISLLHI